MIKTICKTHDGAVKFSRGDILGKYAIYLVDTYMFISLVNAWAVVFTNILDSLLNGQYSSKSLKWFFPWDFNMSLGRDASTKVRLVVTKNKVFSVIYLSSSPWL